MRKETGSYSNYLPLVKLLPWFPELAVEDLPLSRTATLVPAFAMKDLEIEWTGRPLSTQRMKVQNTDSDKLGSVRDPINTRYARPP